MATPKYTLEAGRSILRDGKKFVHIGRSVQPITGEGPNPSDVDEFTRDVVTAMNSHEALKDALFKLSIQVEAANISGPYNVALVEALHAARAALKLVGEKP